MYSGRGPGVWVTFVRSSSPAGVDAWLQRVVLLPAVPSRRHCVLLPCPYCRTPSYKTTVKHTRVRARQTICNPLDSTRLGHIWLPALTIRRFQFQKFAYIPGHYFLTGISLFHFIVRCTRHITDTRLCNDSSRRLSLLLITRNYRISRSLRKTHARSHAFLRRLIQYIN